jgi:hypothetical protein
MSEWLQAAQVQFWAQNSVYNMQDNSIVLSVVSLRIDGPPSVLLFFPDGVKNPLAQTIE